MGEWQPAPALAGRYFYGTCKNLPPLGVLKVYSRDPSNSSSLTRSGGLDDRSSGGVWAITLSPDGNLLAATTHDGRINIWKTVETGRTFRQYETKGSFGISVEIVMSRHEDYDFATYEDSLPTGNSWPLGMRTVVYTSSTSTQDGFFILCLVS